VGELQIVLKHTSGTTVVSLTLMVFPLASNLIAHLQYTSSTIEDTSLHFLHSFIVIVIVRSTYLSRSQMVDSQGRSPFSLRLLVCSVFLQAINYFFIISYYHSIQYSYNRLGCDMRSELERRSDNSKQSR